MSSANPPVALCPRPSFERGFTLIEMMIAVGILAILLAVGIPSMREWIANRQVSNLAESLAEGLRRAQVESIKGNRPTQFVLTSSTLPVGTAADTFNPATLGLTSGGLALTDAAPNWAVRFVDPVTAANNRYFVGRASSEGWVNARVSGTAVLSFSSVGKVQSVANASGTVSTPPAYSVYQVLNPTIDAAVTRRLCVFVTPGGAVKVCDARFDSPDSRSCQPQLTATDCPKS
jgi:type IV fimbrial biogenesis protein FimT